jgi:catechol 2,3-dioxygenase-like lactoylglutathione lyase family enzyme
VPVEVCGIDHIYIAVSDLSRAIAFYDPVMRALGFRKGTKAIAGDPHAHYFNRETQYTIRPAKRPGPHDSYAPGLHHLCFQVPGNTDVDLAVRELRALGVEATEPAFPEYSPDYYATFSGPRWLAPRDRRDAAPPRADPYALARADRVRGPAPEGRAARSGAGEVPGALRSQRRRPALSLLRARRPCIDGDVTAPGEAGGGRTDPGVPRGLRLPTWSGMRPPLDAAWPRRLVAGAALCAVAGGVVTLVGWAFDLPRLTDLRNDGISMFPNAAACAVAGGLALLLRGLADRRWLAVTPWLGTVVALVGGLTLIEHLTGSIRHRHLPAGAASGQRRRPQNSHRAAA